MSPDRFFSGEQRRRLEELMALRREAIAGNSRYSARRVGVAPTGDAEVLAATERATAPFRVLQEQALCRVAERAGHRCEYCHAREAIFNLPFEVEQIVPTSRGGPDDESNLGWPAGHATSTSQINRAASMRRREKSIPSSIRDAIAGKRTFPWDPRTA